MAHGNRGGLFAAGLLTCFVTASSVPILAATNLTGNASARSRDEKSAVLNLALQAVQQLQSQQQATLRAVEDARRQHEQSTASLRHLLFASSALVGAALLAVVLYVRSLRRELQHRSASPLLPRRGVAADDPAHAAHALARRGAALEHAGRLEEALTCYDRALTLDATLAEAYVGRGNVLNRLGRYEEALTCFERASTHQHYTHATVPAVPANS
jgi:tetratricopeptide (TPR) repeat protein